MAAYQPLVRCLTLAILFLASTMLLAADLTGHSRMFDLRWIDVSTGDWGATTTVQVGSKENVSAPGKSGWVAAIVRQ